MIKKYGDVYSGIFFMVFGIVLFISSFSIKRLTISRIGAAFVPQMVAILFVIVSIFVITAGIKKARNFDTTPKCDDGTGVEVSEGVNVKEKNYAPVLTILLLTAYVALLKEVGFIIMSIVFLFLQCIVLAPKEKRNYILFAILSIVVSISVYYFFVNIFNLMLPAGILK